jgi:hypothetical protein
VDRCSIEGPAGTGPRAWPASTFAPRDNMDLAPVNGPATRDTYYNSKSR